MSNAGRQPADDLVTNREALREVVRPLLAKAAADLEALGKHAWVAPPTASGIQAVAGEEFAVSLVCQVTREEESALVFETDISSREIRTFTKVNEHKSKIDRLKTGTVTPEVVEERVGAFIEGLGVTPGSTAFNDFWSLNVVANPEPGRLLPGSLLCV